jgi:hypothetical protein
MKAHLIDVCHFVNLCGHQLEVVQEGRMFLYAGNGTKFIWHGHTQFFTSQTGIQSYLCCHWMELLL